MAVDKFDCIISTQVLNEFSNVCIGKLYIEQEKVEMAVKDLSLGLQGSSRSGTVWI